MARFVRKQQSEWFTLITNASRKIDVWVEGRPAENPAWRLFSKLNAMLGDTNTNIVKNNDHTCTISVKWPYWSDGSIVLEAWEKDELRRWEEACGQANQT